MRERLATRWAVLVLAAALLGLTARLGWIDQRLLETPRKSGWRALARLDPPLAKVAWLHDEQLYYLSTAVNAYMGRGFFPDYNTVRDGVYVPPPLQSLLILIAFGVAGRLIEPFTLIALQAVAAGLAVVLVADLGRRLASPAAGLAMAFLVALHPDFVYWSGYLLTEANYLAGFAALCYCLVLWAEAPSLGRALGLALVLGLLNLQRPNAFWLPPLLAVAALVRLPRRQGLPMAATLLLVPFLVLLPWRQRNVAVYGEPIWVNSNMGVYLYLANNFRLDARKTPFIDYANTGGRMFAPQIETHFRTEDGKLRTTYYEYSKAYQAATTTYLRRRPLHFLRNYGFKFLSQFWFVPEGPLAARLALPPRAYRVFQRLLIAAGLLGLAAMLAWNPGRPSSSLALVAFYFAATGGLAGVDSSLRYTLPLRFLLIVCAAGGVSIVARRWRARRSGVAPDPAKS